MKIIVTGSEGNIGKRLVPYLRSKSHVVHRIDIKQGFGSDYTVANICSANELSETFERFKPDVVYHLAAMVSRITCEASPSLTAEVNLTGVQNIIDLCIRHEAKMVYFSTSEVYGNIGGELTEETPVNPNNFYGLTKYLGEKLVKYAVDNRRLDAVTVRPFMFYDEHEDMGVHRSAMIRFCEALLRNQPVEVHKGATRSWMHMSDAVRALYELMWVPEYDVYNVGHPDVIPVRRIAEIICEVLAMDPEKMIIETDLPGKMTLEKRPSLRRQTELLRVSPVVTIEEGIRRVVNEVSRRIAIDKSLGG